MKKPTIWAIAPTVLIALAGYVAGCGSDDDPVSAPPPEPGALQITVRSAVDSSVIPNSNVVLFDAESNEAVMRDLTDEDGAVKFSVPTGNYYLKISAQGFNAVPLENVTPIPFFVELEDVIGRDVLLDPHPDAGNTGYIFGYVDPALDNFLVLAGSQTTENKYHTASGPDGYFVVHNLPYDSYDMEALKSGFQMVNPVSAMISFDADTDSVGLEVAEYTGSTLTGSVTFLASENSVVDITLLDRKTRAVVPGLTVMNEPEGLTYTIENIPDGDYIAWASLRNDGYIIDPDWLFKNPGGLDIAFTAADTQQLNFSVTDVITLDSPTNPAENTTPAVADSLVPTFSWVPYPSAKEYFIEVRDLDGNIVWGGINDDGTINHAFIGAAADSTIYNFDGQASLPALVPGEVYQWRLWADKGPQVESFVEELISSSEDLRGVFKLPAETP